MMIIILINNVGLNLMAAIAGSSSPNRCTKCKKAASNWFSNAICTCEENLSLFEIDQLGYKLEQTIAKAKAKKSGENKTLSANEEKKIRLIYNCFYCILLKQTY